ncbi:sensor domain-containing diguanylate cyclase [bacterium]|nr:sensor domain-containing diguanylate cyclase [bacterium]
MSIEDIKKQKFAPEKRFRSNKGASRSAWWLKFQVKNPTDKSIDWILKFNYGQFDELQAWQYDDNNTLISHSLKGDHYIDETKISLSKRSSFELITPSKEKNTIYVKFSYPDAGVIETFNSIWTKDEFLKVEQLDNYILVGLLSALVVLLLYNIFIWFILRKKEYFWYNIYLLGVILAIFTFNQIGAHYIWNKSHYLIDMMPFFSAVILFISFIQFTRIFLETNKLLPIIDKLLKVLILVSILGIVLAHIGGRLLAIQMIQVISFTFLFFPLISLTLWYHGYKIARGYTIASSVLSVTVMISILRVSGIIETSELLFWIGRFGFIAEGILLSIALADRITILEHDYKNEQNKLKHTLEEAKRTLISEVKKRTHELEIQTKKAEKLARVDEMTGIWNRRAFLEYGENLITNSNSSKSAFSLIIIDIDHFKRINDTYGHEAGDLVLKTFSQEIRNNMRDSDFFARIGGEEFVILLPNASSEHAIKKATFLLEKINNLDIHYKDSILKITVSMGVSEFVHPDNIYSLLSKADEALYYVKENGRNNVYLYAKD